MRAREREREREREHFWCGENMYRMQEKITNFQ